MQMYRVTATEPMRGTTVTIYARADGAATQADAANILARRGWPDAAATPIPDDQVPPDAAIHIAHSAGQSAAHAADPAAVRRRRLTLIAVGIGSALFLIAMVLFAIKASEHLGRPKTDPSRPNAGSR